MRKRHSLRGTNRLGEDTLAELGFDGVPHDQVHACTQDFFQPSLHVKKVEEPHRAVELDQEIDVAVRTRLATGDRSEQVERTHPQRRQFGLGIGQASAHLFLSHGFEF